MATPKEAPCTSCGWMTHLNSSNSSEVWGKCPKCGNKVIVYK